eukprot:Seg2366.7 transcript_id=Seg2366.7/GoldUCD/mRNA.D3Y31 product="OCIA domain-containing protein 1" protein_id=Seg2366.7/GoldUCD/D3Y31
MASSNDEECNGGALADGQPKQLELSEQEMVALRECRMHSLYLRGFPLGMLSAIATRYLGHHFFPVIKRWAGFSYTGAFTVGLIFGVTSYKDQCFKKIMSLEDSRLAEQVRKFQRKAAGLPETAEIEQESSTSFQGEAFGARSQMAPQYSREQIRSATPSSFYEEDENQGPKSSSYEELRKKHREKQSQGPRRVPHLSKEETEQEHSANEEQLYDPDASYDRRETYSAGSAWESNYPRRTSEDKPNENRNENRNRGITRKNKYGDDME